MLYYIISTNYRYNIRITIKIGNESHSFDELTEEEKSGIIWCKHDNDIVFYYIPKPTILKYLTDVISVFRYVDNVDFIIFRFNEKRFAIDLIWLEEEENKIIPLEDIVRKLLKPDDIDPESIIDIDLIKIDDTEPGTIELVYNLSNE